VRQARVRDLLLWSQVTQRQSRQRGRRALLITNTVRTALGSEPIELAELQGATTSSRDDEEYEAFKGRSQDWAAGLVTDWDADEM